MGQELEEGDALLLDFGKIEAIAAKAPGVIPAVAQSLLDGRVLMIGYVNEQALRSALEEGVAVFWSTSRNRLWVKGAGSGNLLRLREVRVNCEQNSLLYLVEPVGDGVCHTQSENGQHRDSCFYRRIDDGKLEHAPYEISWQTGSRGRERLG